MLAQSTQPGRLRNRGDWPVVRFERTVYLPGLGMVEGSSDVGFDLCYDPTGSRREDPGSDACPQHGELFAERHRTDIDIAAHVGANLLERQRRTLQDEHGEDLHLSSRQSDDGGFTSTRGCPPDFMAMRCPKSGFGSLLIICSTRSATELASAPEDGESASHGAEISTTPAGRASETSLMGCAQQDHPWRSPLRCSAANTLTPRPVRSARSRALVPMDSSVQPEPSKAVT